MEYKVIYAATVGELTKEVQEAIEAGWRPVGGIAVNSHSVTYLQAMVRD